MRAFDFEASGLAHSGPYPEALIWFGRIVGFVDLRQRPPYTPSPEEQLAELMQHPALQGQNKTRVDPEELQLMMDSITAALEPKTEAERAARDAPKARPHPFADDPVLARLGDWDPLFVDIGYGAHQVTDEDAEMHPTIDGGLAWRIQFAPSFEQKAHVSGAVNPTFMLPTQRFDPIVFAEGIRLPFTTYLRRIFQRGGFFGVPRMEADRGHGWLGTREVEQGIFLPDHPIFATLAKDLETF